MRKGKIGYFIIASAIIWGAVIIGCGLILKGTPYKQEITNILIGGASVHLLFLWVPLAKQFRRMTENKPD